MIGAMGEPMAGTAERVYSSAAAQAKPGHDISRNLLSSLTNTLACRSQFDSAFLDSVRRRRKGRAI